ncbi:MAG TPA: class I SAM-dependent methyltransferase, partial [Candidatus Xenobia bacterium]
RRVLTPGGRILILELTRPKYRWLAWMHLQFLRRVVPWMGGLISGDWEAYRWLSTSVAGFMEAATVADLMRQSGFNNVQVWPLSGGICTLMTGVR